nr:hypothetical protein [Tanacetum cinerariifolium]
MWGLKECSSCEALYTKSCACSKGGFADKFVHDPNKTPDSSQRPPKDCPKCGNPIDGLYCRHCALLRKKLKEVWFIICDEHKFFQDLLNTSASSNDDSNIVNMPQEPIVFNQDPSENSSESPPHIDHHCCYGCGDSLDDDEESSTPLRDIIISELPSCIAITPILSTKDSLIMGNEHLDTISKKESNEFIKSSVENLVPNPSESKDERECDVPVCDDFTTFSNIFFDADEISPLIDPHHFNAESDLIEPLLNQNSSIISSSKIDSLLNEFVGELILLKSIPPGIDEADCDPEEEIRLIKKLLYDNSSPRPPKEINFENSDAIIESFSASPIPIENSDPFMEEIYLFLTSEGSIPLVTSSILLSSESKDTILSSCGD